MSNTQSPESAFILRGEDLTHRFPVSRTFSDILSGTRRAVTGVSGVNIAVKRGEVFAVVGESGSGKSTLGRILLGLVKPTLGRVFHEGKNIADFTASERMTFRQKAQVVYQDPFSALNPSMRIGRQIREPLDVHRIGTPSQRNAAVAALLEQVGLDPALARVRPEELSGGMRQRVGIAMALASSPDIIVADEPTSALDVSVQAQILNVLAKLQQQRKLAMVFITHDLGVVSHFADRVAVMYLGRIIEQDDVRKLFAEPKHPYSRMLLSAVPSHRPGARPVPEAPRGEPASPLSPPTGCAFHPRCPHAMERCRVEAPMLRDQSDGAKVACFLFDDGAGQ